MEQEKEKRISWKTHIFLSMLCALWFGCATVGEDICRKRSGAPFDRIMKGVCDCLPCALLRFFYSFESNTRQHRGAVGIQLSARIPNWMADGLSPIDALMLAGFIRRCIYAIYGRAGISDNAQHRRGEKNKKEEESVLCVIRPVISSYSRAMMAQQRQWLGNIQIENKSLTGWQRMKRR